MIVTPKVSYTIEPTLSGNWAIIRHTERNFSTTSFIVGKEQYLSTAEEVVREYQSCH